MLWGGETTGAQEAITRVSVRSGSGQQKLTPEHWQPSANPRSTSNNSWSSTDIALTSPTAPNERQLVRLAHRALGGQLPSRFTCARKSPILQYHDPFGSESCVAEAECGPDSACRYDAETPGTRSHLVRATTNLSIAHAQSSNHTSNGLEQRKKIVKTTRTTITITTEAS